MRSIIPLLVLPLLACSRPPVSPPAPPKETLEERRAACNAAYEHLVDLATGRFMMEQLEENPTKKEAAEYREFVSSQLERRGAPAQFKSHCIAELTRDQVRCETAARDIEKVYECEPD